MRAEVGKPPTWPNGKLVAQMDPEDGALTPFGCFELLAFLDGKPCECVWADEEAGEIMAVVKDAYGHAVREPGDFGDIKTELRKGFVSIRVVPML